MLSSTKFPNPMILLERYADYEDGWLTNVNTV